VANGVGGACGSRREWVCSCELGGGIAPQVCEDSSPEHNFFISAGRKGEGRGASSRWWEGNGSGG
jgi:hypothetical protein